jgi:hypothetical protein
MQRRPPTISTQHPRTMPRSPQVRAAHNKESDMTTYKVNIDFKKGASFGDEFQSPSEAQAIADALTFARGCGFAEKVKAATAHEVYPATKTVYCPSAPTNACDKHADQITALMRMMGVFVVTTAAEPGAECGNCKNQVATVAA